MQEKLSELLLIVLGELFSHAYCN